MISRKVIRLSNKVHWQSRQHLLPETSQLINRDTGSQTNYADNRTAFPYANRRSYNRLSGSSLVIQSYVSNSPSVSLQQSYNPGGVDYYV